jgi:indole-3-glycerol phosphate synthase
MILEEIASYAQKRVQEAKKQHSQQLLEKLAFTLPVGNSDPLALALRKKEMAFLCEVKKASPSKGVIAVSFPYLQIAKEYEEAGAAASSAWYRTAVWPQAVKRYSSSCSGSASWTNFSFIR